MLKALTVWQPWAGCIAHLDKRVENRPWKCPPKYLGTTIAIHAGVGGNDGDGMPWWPGSQEQWASLFATTAEWDAWRHWHMGGKADLVNWPPKLPLGAVVATAQVTGCHKRDEREGCGDGSYAWGAICSRWAQPFQWHWELADVQTLAAPVPCRGYQKLWTLQPADEAAVRAQVKAAV